MTLARRSPQGLIRGLRTGLRRLTQNQRRFYLAQIISALGTRVSALAIPTLAVVRFQATPAQVALLTAVGYLPTAVLGPFAGALIDRRIRTRGLLVLADCARAAAIASVPVLDATGSLSLSWLFAQAATIGALNPLFSVGSQAILPKIVPADALPQGNALVSISNSGGQLAGPAIGGLLIQALGAARSTIADAVSYLVSAALIGRISEPRSEARPPSRIRTDLREGFVTVASHRQLRRLVAGAALLNLGGSGIGGLYVLYAYRFVHMSAAELGVNYALGSAAGLVGGFAAPRIIDRAGLDVALRRFAVASGFALLLIPLANTFGGQYTLGVYQLAFTFNSTIWAIAMATIRLRISPQDQLGRIAAFGQSAVLATLPVGAAIGGVLADLVGVQPTLLIMAAFAGLAVVMASRSGKATDPEL